MSFCIYAFFFSAAGNLNKSEGLPPFFMGRWLGALSPFGQVPEMKGKGSESFWRLAFRTLFQFLHLEYDPFYFLHLGVPLYTAVCFGISNTSTLRRLPCVLFTRQKIFSPLNACVLPPLMLRFKDLLQLTIATLLSKPVFFPRDALR